MAAILKYCPVIMPFVMVGYGIFYAIARVAMRLLPSIALRILYLVFFMILCGLWTISYWRAITTSSQVPDFISADEPGATRCRRCHKMRPARAHHCRHCGHCVLKYDHHCPWIANCVGENNHKFFILFLFYSAALGLCTAASAAADLSTTLTSETLQSEDRGAMLYAIIALALGGVNGLLLTCFGGMHCSYAMNDSTTLERVIDDDNATAPTSRMQNLRAFFGPSLYLWPLPTTAYKTRSPSLLALLPQCWLRDEDSSTPSNRPGAVAAPFSIRFELCLLLCRKILDPQCPLVRLDACQAAVAAACARCAAVADSPDRLFIRLLYRAINEQEEELRWLLDPAAQPEDATLLGLEDRLTHMLESSAGSAWQVPDGHSPVSRVIINNEDVVPDNVQIDQSNRVTRHFAFLAERFTRLWFYRCSAARKRDVLARGFSIAGRHFSFLAYTKNQVLTGKCWFFAEMSASAAARIDKQNGGSYEDVDGAITCDSLRGWLGDFSVIGAPHQYASRLGMSFTDTVACFDVPDEHVDFIDDEIVTSSNIEYCFTDGCGLVSPEVAARAWQCVRRAALAPPLSECVPSAFQVRFMGCKGVLVVSDRLPDAAGRHLLLRKSMLKYSCEWHRTLEVLRYSAPEAGLLSRQIIVVLNYLGIGSDAITAALLDGLQQYAALGAWAPPRQTHFLTPPDALRTLCAARALAHRGLEPERVSPHFAAAHAALRATQARFLRSRTIGLVPNARSALGVVDESGRLRYGEIFFQRTDDGSARGAVVTTGRVFVAKTPCMHPGDIRVLEAVDVPELHHLRDCVVFPKQGPRPHPLEISGGDLDGDSYLVCWHRALVPQQHAPPANYHSSFSYDADVNTTTLDGNSSVADMAAAVHGGEEPTVRPSDVFRFDETNFMLRLQELSRDREADARRQEEEQQVRDDDDDEVVLEEDVVESPPRVETEMGTGGVGVSRSLQASAMSSLRSSPLRSPSVASSISAPFTPSVLLHIAREAFVRYERYHPDKIANAHLAIADERGIDDPVARKLAEQFSTGIDAIKTGKWVPPSAYRTPSEWPHFMEHMRGRPRRRSNACLGRVHDAICAHLAGQMRAEVGATCDADLLPCDDAGGAMARALCVRNVYHDELRTLRHMYSFCPIDHLDRVLHPYLHTLRARMRELALSLCAPLSERCALARCLYTCLHDTRYSAPALWQPKTVEACEAALAADGGVAEQPPFRVDYSLFLVLLDYFLYSVLRAQQEERNARGEHLLPSPPIV